MLARQDMNSNYPVDKGVICDEKKSLIYRRIKFARVLKGVAVFILVLLPFQKFPETVISGGKDQVAIPLPIKMFGQIDEASFLFFTLVLVSFLLLNPRNYRLNNYPFFKWIISFLFCGILWVFVNNTGSMQGFLGIYGYLKNVAVIILFAWLSFDINDFRKCVSATILVAVVLSFGGIIGEILALGFNLGINILVDDTQRFGLYRVISFTGNGNWNYIGIYGALAFFLVYAKNKQKFYYSKLTLILILVLLSLSRQAWICFILMFLAIVKINKKIVCIMTPLIVCASIAVIVYWGGITSSANMSGSLDESRYFRYFTFLQAIEIINDHPFSGIGPGMFGGVASVIFESPYYDKWPKSFKEQVYQQKGLDQFWVGLFADMGIIGGILFVAIFVSIFLVLRKASRFYKRIDNKEMEIFGKTFYVFIFCIFIMGLAGGINCAFLTFTYFSLSGIYISIYNKNRKEEYFG